jgi:hypothetical protein
MAASAAMQFDKAEDLNQLSFTIAAHLVAHRREANFPLMERMRAELCCEQGMPPRARTEASTDCRPRRAQIPQEHFGKWRFGPGSVI